MEVKLEKVGLLKEEEVELESKQQGQQRNKCRGTYPASPNKEFWIETVV
jgi:hypothetical protein